MFKGSKSVAWVLSGALMCAMTSTVFAAESAKEAEGEKAGVAHGSTTQRSMRDELTANLGKPIVVFFANKNLPVRKAWLTVVGADYICEQWSVADNPEFEHCQPMSQILAFDRANDKKPSVPMILIWGVMPG